MAISLNEYLGATRRLFQIQIFSTDVSEKAIAIARKGVYSRAEVGGDLSPNG